MPWHVYLALKHLFPTGRRATFSSAVAIIGVAIGVWVLVIVVSVMEGFGHEIRRKVVDTGGHLRIESNNLLSGAYATRLVEQVEAMPEVLAAAPYAQGVVMVQYRTRPSFPFVRGIDVMRGDNVLALQTFMSQGSLDDLDDDTVLLGMGLAQTLGARVGDKIDVYTPLMLDRMKREEVLLPRELKVAGLFESGWGEVDSNTLIVTMRLMQDLYGLGSSVHGVAVRLKPGEDVDAVKEKLLNTLPPHVYPMTYLESYRDFLFVIQLEKSMMFFIVMVTTVVAAFSIASSLFTNVVRKTREIGLLGALGGTPWQCGMLFCLQGFMIGVTGMVLGLGSAFLTLSYRNEIINAFASITHSKAALVRFYQFANLPVKYSASDLTIICLAAVLGATIAGLLPALRAARLKPSDALRRD